MKYVLDTTWIVEYLRGNEHVVRRVQGLQEEGLGVSIISVAELFEGVFRSKSSVENEQALRDFLGGVTVLPISEEIARIYGEKKAALVKKGAAVGSLDLLIAATALAAGTALFTFDSDFQRVEGLAILGG
ncbi:MAG: type II toxin-antitoxin system VapC family toxin [Chloroflexi bacterium]|nr:type II toxin-antitoxin system VapC family toxin [Chloroflexota bacterium]